MSGRMEKRIRNQHGEKFVKYAKYLCERPWWTRLFVTVFILTHGVKR